MASQIYNYEIERKIFVEFPNLKDTVYVDHVGATLYSRSQMEAVQRDLLSNLYGNPHSHNASSKLATDTVDQIRARILHMFGTSHDEYGLIFTSGCTASLKIVADCFMFGPNGSPKEGSGIFCYLRDNHTSVQGMREVVADRCSDVLCLDEDELVAALNSSLRSQGEPAASDSSVDPKETSSPAGPQSLCAFPAQSNFSGRKYPQEWVVQCRNSGLDIDGHRSDSWYVLWDTAAYASTSPLDLSKTTPDFATVSFYKMFGYPTGLGALLVHKRAWSSLQKRYFGGGTVAASTAKGRFHAFWKVLHSRFEDGTVPYLSIISLKHGIDTLNRLTGGMQAVCSHVFCVAQFFYNHLVQLRHSNGASLAEIYGGVRFIDPSQQGGVVTFNLCRSDRSYIGYSEVDKFANLHDVHIRTGCFCNIGACQDFLDLSDQLIKENFDAGHVCGDNMDMIGGRPTGAVRISFGYMSTISDARACLRFIADSFLEVSSPAPTFPNPEWYNTEMPAKTVSDVITVNGSQGIDLSVAMETNSGVTHTNTGGSVDINNTSSVSGNTQGDSQGRWLADIHLFPIKSCAAFKVKEWEMGARGLLYDREWVLVTDAGVTVGQKRIPEICMLAPHIDLETRRLTLFFPGAECFVLPLDQDATDMNTSASFCTNKVCGDRVNTFDCGDDVSNWLSKVLNFSSVRLLRQQSTDNRRSRLRGSDPQQLSMANESQILLLNRASVRSLQTKMVELSGAGDTEDSRVTTAPEDISEDNLLLRFRGNLTVDGGEGFEEESWESISIGKHTVKCIGQCTRCSMICMDQETAKKSREPLKTLSVWRGKKVPFGVHSRMLPNGDGSRQIIQVGDPVVVLSQASV